MGNKHMVPGFHPGSKSPKGRGQTLKELGFYHKPAWRRMRKQALQRDHYLCQECLRSGKITQATEVHHIMDLEHFPSLALEISNLESLCWQCHEQTKQHKAVPSIPGVRIIQIKNDADSVNLKNVSGKEESKESAGACPPNTGEHTPLPKILK